MRELDDSANRVDRAERIGNVCVRIERGVVPILAIDHAGRFLARRCVIEVDERLAMDCLFQDREVLAPSGDIELEVSSLDSADFVDGAFHDNVPTVTRSDKSPCNRSRSGAMPQRLTISSAKARVSSLLAASSSTPRERR